MGKEKVTGKGFDYNLLGKIYSLIGPHKTLFYLSVFLTLMIAVIGPLIPMFIQRTIDNQILQLDFQGLFTMSGYILSLLLLQTLLNYFHTYITHYLGQNAIYYLRKKVFDHITAFKSKVFDRTPLGTFITRTISDIETVADVFSQGLINIIGDSLQLVIIIAIMFHYEWRLTLVTLSVFPVLLVSSYVFKEKIKGSFTQVRNEVAKLNAFLQEHITGMQIVQVFNREEQEEIKFRKINARHRDANERSVLYYSVFFPVIEILSAISIALVVWYGARGVLEGTITFGQITAFILYIYLLFRPIRQIADKFNTLQMGMVASERIFKLMEKDDSIPNTGTIVIENLRGNVEFTNVCFAYENENFVLNDVSFEVKEGEVLAIVGSTGAGKSTIINLINRLYEINKGEIKIDGINVRELELAWLRKNIAVVLQDVFLFSDTIKNNIRLYNEKISDEQVIEAAKLVGAHDFIMKLPGGYDYQVQERGATLSAGQRQLISFIRAIIQNPRVLILDEATSSIDHETEEMIQHAVKILLKDRTSIVIAHRLSTIQTAHQILVMEKGKILERGTHRELINQGGKYSKLVQLQFTEFVPD